MKKKCKRCGELKEHKAHGFCESCYQKEEYTYIPGMGCGQRKGSIPLIWTNGVTKEVKPLIKKIKEKVLNDCIKNPSKYLNQQETKKNLNDKDK